jgi:hypothetical protein
MVQVHKKRWSIQILVLMILSLFSGFLAPPTNADSLSSEYVFSHPHNGSDRTGYCEVQKNSIQPAFHGNSTLCRTIKKYFHIFTVFTIRNLYRSNVRIATSLGFMSGVGNGVFDPAGYAMRAEAAVVLKRFLNHVN